MDNADLIRLDKAVPGMKCSKCRTVDLHEIFVEGVAIDRCDSCDGVWLDSQELNELLAEDARHVASLRRGKFTSKAEGKRGFCPRDSVELLRVYSAIERSVVLDVCPDCGGIWLDGGEFEKLFAARRP